jgi:ABC-type lipoprotein export system ATPase subunit/GNAT superfamily N-acetyltransferase
MSMPSNKHEKHYKVFFEVQPENTSLLVAEAFGVGPGWVNHIVDVTLPKPLPQITLITGESGCGKSTLLRELGETSKFFLPDLPLHAWANTDEESLRLLNSVGLNDASLFVLHYSQLSDSQQARARMFYWLCQKEKTLVIDEFLATLDRQTAKALAYSFQRMLRREGISLIAATAQSDLADFLQPDLLVKGTAFPSEWETETGNKLGIMNPFATSICIKQETKESGKITSGGTCLNCRLGTECVCPVPNKLASAGKDAYRESRLGEIHYKGKYVGGPQEYFSARLDDKIVGWLVGTKVRNEKYRIARVIVHPTYRGCGLGQRLIREYLNLHPDADTVAAMARFNPVFERAGMRRVDDIDIQPQSFFKDIPLTPLQWASKEECQKLLKQKKYLDIIVEHADELGRDTHPGGIKPDNMSVYFENNLGAAAQALWRCRPRKMAKFVGRGIISEVKTVNKKENIMENNAENMEINSKTESPSQKIRKQRSDKGATRKSTQSSKILEAVKKDFSPSVESLLESHINSIRKELAKSEAALKILMG